MAAERSQPAIRPACADDASFIARNILASQRGPLSRGWFDIALGWDEPRCLAFVERIATAQTPSWWHVSQFIIAEVSECDYCDSLPLVFFSSRYHLGPGRPVDH